MGKRKHLCSENCFLVLTFVRMPYSRAVTREHLSFHVTTVTYLEIYSIPVVTSLQDEIYSSSTHIDQIQIFILAGKVTQNESNVHKMNKIYRYHELHIKASP